MIGRIQPKRKRDKVVLVAEINKDYVAIMEEGVWSSVHICHYDRYELFTNQTNANHKYAMNCYLFEESQTPEVCIMFDHIIDNGVKLQ